MRQKYLTSVFIIFIFFISSFKVLSQNYVLLDRQMNWYSYLCDSITSGKYSEYLPMYISDIDSLVLKLEPLEDIAKLGLKRTYLDENLFSTGHIVFKIQNIGGAYGDKYNILLISEIQSYQFTMRLAASEEGVYSSKEKIVGLRNYLIKVKKQIDKGKVKTNCSPK